MNTTTKFGNASRIQAKIGQASLVAALLLAIVSPQTQAAPGDVDLSFDPGSDLNGVVSAVALQDDGKILIGGDFTTVHGAMRSGIARLNADGSVDDSFLNGMAGAIHTSLDMWINQIVLQGDGKILIAGYFTSFNGTAKTNIARLNPDGSLDSSFNIPAGSAQWMKFWLQPDGKILVTGTWGTYGVNLARFDADGTQDYSFHADLVDAWQSVSQLTLQDDGKIIVVGPAGSGITNVPLGSPLIARLNADGSADDSFTCQITSAWSINAPVVQPDGKILLGGLFSGINGVARTNLARVNADGSLDRSFLFSPPQESGSIYSMALQSDGKIVIAGWEVNGPGANLARLNSDGTLNNSFLSTPDSQVNLVVLQSDGRILISGPFTSINGVRRKFFARINSDGSVDSSFASGPSGPDGFVRAIGIQNDGKIFIGGIFNWINGVAQSGLARLNADGSLDGSFSDTHFERPPKPDNPYVYSLAMQPDGRIVLGGQFTLVNGVAQTNIARLNADGSLDTSFHCQTARPNGDPNSIVQSLALQSDGKILIAGDFTTVNGAAQTNIARLNADGSLDTSFNASLGPLGGSGGPVAIQKDGKIVVAGSFSSVNGVERHNIARLNADGSLDTAFQNRLAGVNNWVLAIALQPDGKILIGSQFSSVNGIARTNLARLNADGSLDNSFLGGPDGAASGVNYLALQSDGKILIAGWFDTVNGVPRNHIALLNPDGSLDTNFLSSQIGPNDNVDSVAIQPDGKILLGGDFTAVNQIPRSHVTRLFGELPTIIALVQSATTEAGSTIDFTPEVEGCPPVTCLLSFDGTNLITCGAEGCLRLMNVDFSQSGTYTVVVTNIFGAVTSAPITLNVIPPVERRPVPGINLTGEAGSVLNLEYTESLGPTSNWLPLDTVSLSDSPQYWFDLTEPLPSQRFYRVWQIGTPAVFPSLSLPALVPAITLTGNVGDTLRLDGINQFGPTDAWVTLDTVTLTNTSQLYFDTSSIGQPRRLYRIMPGP